MHDNLRRFTYILYLGHYFAAERNPGSMYLGDSLERHLDIVDKGKHAFKKYRIGSLICGTDRYARIHLLLKILSTCGHWITFPLSFVRDAELPDLPGQDTALYIADLIQFSQCGQ